MTTPESPKKTNVIVMDRFANEELIDFVARIQRGEESTEDLLPIIGSDTISTSLNHERHDVRAIARNLTEACKLLIALKSGELEGVDAIILAGELDHDPNYFHKPISHTEEVVEEKKKLFGGTKEVTRTKTTHLIPVKKEDGTIGLPEGFISNLDWLDYQKDLPIENRAAYILAHLIHNLLPDMPVVIHSSNANDLKHLPAAAHVHKEYSRIPNPDSELARAIDEVAA